MAAVVNTVNYSYTALSESVVSSFLYSVLLIVCRAHRLLINICPLSNSEYQHLFSREKK